MEKRTIALAILSLLILALAASIIVPVVTGSTQLLIVLSGSMHPVMRVGDMVVVNSVSPDELNPGDIIAYRDPGGAPDVLITHRIISVTEGEERVFQTKGDANEEEDAYLVPASKLVGRTVFVIPFAGYLPEATKNSMLFILTVIIPALLIIIDEIKSIQKNNHVNARKIQKMQRKKLRVPSHIIRSRRLSVIMFASMLILTMLILPNLGDNGYAAIASEYPISNNGALPAVAVITPDDLQQRISITPWYTVLPPNSETNILSDEHIQVAVTSVPYILPVFWIVRLANINPYLPSIAIITIYTFFVTIILLPLWYRKAMRRSHRNKFKIRQVFSTGLKMNRHI